MTRTKRGQLWRRVTVILIDRRRVSCIVLPLLRLFSVAWVCMILHCVMGGTNCIIHPPCPLCRSATPPPGGLHTPREPAAFRPPVRRTKLHLIKCRLADAREEHLDDCAPVKAPSVPAGPHALRSPGPDADSGASFPSPLSPSDGLCRLCRGPSLGAMGGRLPPATGARGVLKGRDFFFLLRTALKDRPKGPPTANRQLPSTPNRHQPPTTNRHQPPATNRRQPPAATNRQLPTTANRLQPPTASHQPPPTAANRQLPTANRQPPPTANRQLPPTMVEHMECPRAFLGKLVPENFFFSR